MSLHRCGLVIEKAEWALQRETQINGKNGYCLSTIDIAMSVFHAFIVTFNIPNTTFPLFYRQYLNKIFEDLNSE